MSDNLLPCPAHDAALDRSLEERAEGFGAILKDEAKRLRSRADELDPPHSAASTVEPVVSDEELALKIGSYLAISNLEVEDIKYIREMLVAPTTSPEPSTCKDSLQVQSSREPVADFPPELIGAIAAGLGQRVRLMHPNGQDQARSDLNAFKAWADAYDKRRRAAVASPEPDAVREKIATILQAEISTSGEDYIDLGDSVDRIAALSAPVAGEWQEVKPNSISQDGLSVNLHLSFPTHKEAAEFRVRTSYRIVDGDVVVRVPLTRNDRGSEVR